MLTKYHQRYCERREIFCKAPIPNIDVLISDTHTLFLSILILNSQCLGVTIEDIDIWYMGLTTQLLR